MSETFLPTSFLSGRKFALIRLKICTMLKVPTYQLFKQKNAKDGIDPICESNPANNERQKWVELNRSGLCWDTKRTKRRAHCLSADRVFETSHILGLTFAGGPPVITLIGPARPFVGKVDVLQTV